MLTGAPIPLPQASAALTAQAVPQGGTAPAALAAAPQDADGEVTLSVDALSPEVLSSQEDLIVSGTVTNATQETQSTSSLVIDVQGSTEISPSGLNAWLADERDTSMDTAATSDFTHEIPPGGTLTFSVTVEAGNLPLSDETEWGPRGLEVTLSDGMGPVAHDRTIVVWDPGVVVSPTRVTAVVPVIASTSEILALWERDPEAEAEETASPSPEPTATASATSAAADSTAGGAHTAKTATPADPLTQRVLGLLGLAGDGVVLAVDPALLEALGVEAPTAEKATEPDAAATAPPTNGPPSEQPAGQPTDKATTLAHALRQAVSAGDVVVLPWTDADISALTHLGETDLLSTALTRAAESGTTAAGARTDLAWTAGHLDASTMAALPESVSTVIAAPGDLPVTDTLTYTPSGSTVLDGRTVLIPDDILSGAVSGELLTADDVITLSQLDAVQLLRAQIAILTRQAPSVSRDVVVVVSRAQAPLTDPEELEARLTAITSSSWTKPQNLDALTETADESAPTQVERSEPPDTAVADGEVTAEELQQARETATYLGSVSSILTDPEAALGTTTDVVIHSAAATWRSDPAGRSCLAAAAQRRGQAVSESLTAAPSSTVNLISATADLPVRIVSSLNQDATVRVRLVPSSTRLQAPQVVEVAVPANSQATAMVPVKAVGSGNVDVTIELLAEDGTVVGVPATVHMRVRADWESIGTSVLGACLAVLLVVGIVRTVRGGRRNPEPQETA